MQIHLHYILVLGELGKVATKVRWPLNKGDHISRFDCTTGSVSLSQNAKELEPDRYQ